MKGADINAKTISYHNLAIFICVKCIKIKKRKLNQQNSTPLHYAIIYNLKEIGEILISKGADINAIDIININIRFSFKLQFLTLNKGNLIRSIKLLFIMLQRKLQKI